MIDPVQLVLLIVIVVLTVLLIVLGIQVYFILKDLRTTLWRVNKILDNTENITEGISQPLSFLSGIFASGKTVNTVSKIFKTLRREAKDDE